MKKIINVICLILILQLNSTAIAQTMSGSEFAKEIDENYSKLLSENIKERDQAVFFFSKLKKEELSKRVVDALGELFQKEIKQTKGVYKIKKGAITGSSDEIASFNGENYGIYFGRLCEIVGKSGDRKMLPLLVAHCLESKVLTNFGDDAVELVINHMSISDNPIGKMNALFVLDEMLKPKKEGYVASGEMRNKIKKALIQATLDKDRHVKSLSVKALGNSEDDDVIPILEKIAKEDPDHFFDKDISTGRKKAIYPVREEAEKALKKFKEKKLVK